MSANIYGVGPDAPTIANKKGGKQSSSPYRMDLIDPDVLLDLASIVRDGAEKYGEWNWRNLSVEENLNHAMIHVLAWLAGDRQDNHLGHAFCRLMFARSLDIDPGLSERMIPEE